MILNLLFADAAKQHEGGTLSALGLGIATVRTPAFPLDYEGCAVMVVSADVEAGGMVGQEVEVALEGQAGGKWLPMATGMVRFGSPPGPSLFAVKFATRIEREETRKFRLRSGSQAVVASIEFRLTGQEQAQQESR